MNKQIQLDNLKQKMAAADLPLKETATNLVFGEGSINPKIYFIGEAPGRFEDLSGLPFVGQAGKLLVKMLETLNLTREDVYITSVVRYRPPQNRDPKPSELEAFRPYVDEEIAIIKPKVIATLGRFSMNKFLPEVKISEVHGKSHPITYNGLSLIIFPLYHPAAALRSTKLKSTLEQDFQKLKEFL